MADLSSALLSHPFLVTPLEMLFIGGPMDGRVDSVMSTDLECRIGGHAYKLAITKSDDPTVPYRYCLVSRTLVPERGRIITL